MYAAIRPALRLQSRTPARFIRGRRYPQPQRVQSFHSTRFLAQNPNPTPSPDDTPAVNSGDADKKKSEQAAAGEPVDTGAAATEDPDVLAQKLQKSRETTKRISSALRRSQRRNRAQDLPPVHIPDWYLEKRVRLREDAPPPPAQREISKRHEYAVTLRDSDSGESASVSIPGSTYQSAAAFLAALSMAMWRKPPAREDMELLAQDFARRLGREDDADFVAALLDNKRDSFTTEAARDEKDPDAASAEADSIREHLLLRGKGIAKLQVAEIRANVAACLSTVQPAINHTFPAAKTNLVLQSPISGEDAALDAAVRSLAFDLGADVVTLEAQDLAQIAGDYLGDGPGSSPNSIRSLGYATHKLAQDFSFVVLEDELPGEGQEPGQEQHEHNVGGRAFHLGVAAGMKAVFNPFTPTEPPSISGSRTDSNLEDLKLSSLLEALVDATELKRERAVGASQSTDASAPPPPAPSELASTAPELKLFDYSFKAGGEEIDFSSLLPVDPTAKLTFGVHHKPSSGPAHIPQQPKIIYVKDIKQLNGTQYGSKIIQKLEDIVKSRRNSGESIMILGTTSSADLIPEMSPLGISTLQSDGGDGLFRTIVVTPRSKFDREYEASSDFAAHMKASRLTRMEKMKHSDINLRHIQDMLRSLDPASTLKISDMDYGSKSFRNFSSSFPASLFLAPFSYDEVHRISLTALGLRQLDPNAEQVTWAHVTLAMGLLNASDKSKFAFVQSKAQERPPSVQDMVGDWKKKRTAMHRPRDPLKAGAAAPKRQREVERIKQGANQHEKKLLSGIVNPEDIKTTFESIHVPRETIEAVRTLTSLALLRPDAFDYGILATEKVSGALLYGPPGTGKTLLAKAVAKESGCAVLEVSGAQIMDKYVGEGEKNVAAIFSLARKLSPCIVFLDEADAIFGSRDRSSERTSHRDILNQFLKEWDGLNNNAIFVMVATNRPFDMDDAVIRRLPRRLLVDLPLQEDRKKILEIHLKGEQLDPSVDINDLAKRTPLYSGSDLKNVAVFAAIACVREENEQAALAAAKAALAATSLAAATETTVPATEQESASSIPLPLNTTPDPTGTFSAAQTPTSLDSPFPPSPPPSSSSTHSAIPQLTLGHTYTFPERRTLHLRHFDKALQEVSASISENMASLTAIKKFDEQYGDRKGRKKKTQVGFGTFVEEQLYSEKEGRVRP